MDSVFPVHSAVEPIQWDFNFGYCLFQEQPRYCWAIVRVLHRLDTTPKRVLGHLFKAWWEWESRLPVRPLLACLGVGSQDMCCVDGIEWLVSSSFLFCYAAPFLSFGYREPWALWPLVFLPGFLIILSEKSILLEVQFTFDSYCQVVLCYIWCKHFQVFWWCILLRRNVCYIVEYIDLLKNGFRVL